MPTPRIANVKAVTQCDLFVLERADFHRIMQDNPQFADAVAALAKERYNITISGADLITG